MIVTYQNRKVDIELEGVCYDHDYWCDTYIDEATWCDTGLPLADAEIDAMQESGNMCEWIADYLC